MKRTLQGDAGVGTIGLGFNEVVLSGRISGSPEERELPSGDSVVQLRLVVPRTAYRGRAGGGGATVDTIDVSCWTKALQRKAVRLKPGDLVTIRGALRRRFWRSPGGPASRYDVEATGLDRHVTAPTST
ncbi:MAG TPA: single-stranded DNA-binding protein [Dermatophilaceae bacterium]